MPLPPGVPSRKRIHTRSIEVEGWRREDGLLDIEAHLSDVKHHALMTMALGLLPAGEPVHDMQVRLTIDQDFCIVAATIVSDAVPYPEGCKNIIPDYACLVGLNLLRGFRQRVGELFAGVRGCTHLTELLKVMPSVAIQTFAGEKRGTEGLDPLTQPFQLDRCHALSTGSETVRRYYPRWFKGQNTGQSMK